MSGFGGGTAINDGLSRAVDVLEADTAFVNKVVVIFTDGNENSSKMSQSEVIAKAKSKGIKIFAIDFGANIGGKYMTEIAEQTGGCYYHIYGTDEFNYVFNDIYLRIKNAYIFEYTPSVFGQLKVKLGLCNEKHKIEMETKINYEPLQGNFIFLNLNFDFNKSEIKKEFHNDIERIMVLMNHNKNIKIEIKGHTDDVGDDNSNIILSQKRADAVRDELIKLGIDASRLTAKGFGESFPVSDNATKEGRYLNRRTEFFIVK
jgi:OOP family OmpA-OmpF porin